MDIVCPFILSSPLTAPSIRFDLEMMYYFCQIVLHRPFLHYLKKMADGEALSPKWSQSALLCIKFSSITITRAEDMIKRKLLEPASWLSIYTIFLSVVSLIFLIAAHKGTSTPSEAWKKALAGIQLLAALRCGDNIAVRSLTVLKVCVSLRY